MRFINTLRSQIQYKIILPFLLLTLLVALAGSAVAVLFVTISAQERLNNQLGETARAASDRLVELEQDNLQSLRALAFAGPNVANNTLSMGDAFASGDPTQVTKALEPYFIAGTTRSGIPIDRMIAFTTDGHSVFDWEQSANLSEAPTAHELRDMSQLWFVPAILGKQSDPLGDKYSGLLDLGSSEDRYLFTVAPVLQNGNVVGGVIVGSRLETVLQDLAQQSSVAIITVYRPEDGKAFASSLVPAAGLATLDIQPDLVGYVRDIDLAASESRFDTLENVDVNQRDYQFAYVPLVVRGSMVGILSVALSSDYVIGPWENAGWLLAVLVVVLTVAIVGLGFFIARQITRPLEELVSTAEAVTQGAMERRSSVHTRDEVGSLSRSFNAMTEHLVALYDTVQSESSQRAAIVESIADGVVVCDLEGRVLVLNRAMRDLLELAPDAAAPGWLAEISLQPLDETAIAFGDDRVTDLFALGNKVVRVAAATVPADDGSHIGEVFVFQDMTNETAINRAKTNFIATISHELRTPLTVLGGSADLLLRGYVGDLNDDQRMLIETMQKHSQSMTSLLNNVIIIAGLESGSLEFEIAPLPISQVFDELRWNHQGAVRKKGLQLEFFVSPDLPQVIADEHQLRNVLSQLVDNARRYTTSGTIKVVAYPHNNTVRIDVSDTGPGIDAEVSANLFNRFVRGAEGINSTERGIGLGLAIVKMLIERQGGSVWLEESTDRGSTFSLTIPCVHATSTANNQIYANAA